MCMRADSGRFKILNQETTLGVGIVQGINLFLKLIPVSLKSLSRYISESRSIVTVGGENFCDI